MRTCHGVPFAPTMFHVPATSATRQATTCTQPIATMSETCMAYPPSARRLLVDDGAEIRDVVFESAPAVLRQRHTRARALGDEVLFNCDVTGFLERGDMRAEISFRGAHEPLEPHELDLVAGRQPPERGHDLQAHGLMDDGVGLVHHKLLSQTPPRISAPPPISAIQMAK